MGSTQKVTAQQLLRVFAALNGDVAKTARAVGIHRNNVYKRLIAMGVNPDDYRLEGGTVAPGGHRVAEDGTGLQPSAVTAPTQHVAAHEPERAASDSRAANSASAIYRGKVVRHTFGDVSTATPTETVTAEPDVKAALKKPKSFYLRPEQIEQVEDSVIDLGFALRIKKLSPSQVLELFIDECFSPWLREKSKPAKKAKQ